MIEIIYLWPHLLSANCVVLLVWCERREGLTCARLTSVAIPVISAFRAIRKHLTNGCLIAEHISYCIKSGAPTHESSKSKAKLLSLSLLFIYKQTNYCFSAWLQISPHFRLGRFAGAINAAALSPIVFAFIAAIASIPPEYWHSCYAMEAFDD